MWIMVAGPITSIEQARVQANVHALNQACLDVLKKGHIPILAHNFAAPIRELDASPERQERYVKLCIALTERCDALLVLGRSPGVDLELERFTLAKKPVYWSLSEIPPCPNS